MGNTKTLVINKINVISLLMVLSVSLCFLLSEVPGNTFVILGINVLAFYFACSTTGRYSLHLFYEYFYLLAFIIFCYLSSIWALNGKYSIDAATAVVLNCIVSLLYVEIVIRSNMDFFYIIAISGIIVSIGTIMFYGPGTIVNSVFGIERIGNELCNSNTLGILFAISGTIFFYLFIEDYYIWHLILTIYMLFMILSTQSRKSIVIIAFGLAAVLIIRFSTKQVIKNIFRAVIVLIILFFVIRYLLTLEIFSTIKSRLDGMVAMFTGVGELDGSAMLRQMYIKIGMSQFRKTPILGIGIDNARFLIVRAQYHHDTYTHNNFVELLCDGGIVGFFIYYLFYLVLFIQYFKSRKAWSRYTKFCLFFLILIIIMDYGMVSYLEKTTYMFLVPVFAEMVNLQRQDITGASNA